MFPCAPTTIDHGVYQSLLTRFGELIVERFSLDQFTRRERSDRFEKIVAESFSLAGQMRMSQRSDPPFSSGSVFLYTRAVGSVILRVTIGKIR